MIKKHQRMNNKILSMIYLLPLKQNLKLEKISIRFNKEAISRLKKVNLRLYFKFKKVKKLLKNM